MFVEHPQPHPTHAWRPQLALALLGVVTMATAAGVGACGDDGAALQSTPATEIERALLENVGQNIILQLYADFDTQATTLVTATERFAQTQDDANRDAARAAWQDTMALWQQAEMLQLGPAGIMGEVAGGEDLRDEIYSWPVVNECRVDQEIVEAAFEDLDAFAQEPVNVRGLDAMEYLLFSEGDDNACAPNSSINRDGLWQALGSEEIARRRAAYAHALAQLIDARASQLHDAWDPASGDFLKELTGAGAESTTFSSGQEALNALSDALFYLEKETKDMKLAEPVGLADCDADLCPDALESPRSRRSKEHILANVLAFQRAYLGGEPGEDGVGFDDLLRDRGADEVADAMNAEIDEAIAAIEAIDGPIEDAINDDKESVIAAHDAVREIVVLLKTQFVSVLDLEIPQRAEGDND